MHHPGGNNSVTIRNIEGARSRRVREWIHAFRETLLYPG